MELSARVDLNNDYFSLLDVPRTFSVDKKQLKANARRLLRQYHPDALNKATPSEKRIAEQFAAHINHARSVLEDTLPRAGHLLELSGVDADFDNRTIDDRDFLMRQMQLRERLEDAATRAEFEDLRQVVKEAEQQLQALFVSVDFTQSLAERTAAELQSALAKMHFYAKFAEELRIHSSESA